MSKKNKNVNETDEEFDDVDEDEINDDVVVDFEEPKTSKELKAEAKAKAKQEKQEELEFTEDILNKRSKTKAGQTFKMYKFIIKIIIFAVLVAFAVVLWIYKAEMIGAVYLISGIGITFTAIIRMIPLLKTTKSNTARVILLVQCLIHLVIGLYLIVAAFVHWGALNQLIDDGVKREELLDNLNKASGGWFAKFNMVFYIYLMVVFFWSLSGGYFWVTIRHGEKTSKSLFWLMMISYTLSVVLALIAKYLDARTLIITLIVLIAIGAVCVAGEAGGGYYRYRKALVAERPKKQAKVEDGKEAPSRKEEVDYTDIDTGIIPQDEPGDDANIVM